MVTTGGLWTLIRRDFECIIVKIKIMMIFIIFCNNNIIIKITIIQNFQCYIKYKIIKIIIVIVVAAAIEIATV